MNVMNLLIFFTVVIFSYVHFLEDVALMCRINTRVHARHLCKLKKLKRHTLISIFTLYSFLDLYFLDFCIYTS